MKTSKRKKEIDLTVKNSTKKPKINALSLDNIFENTNVYILPQGSQISKLQIKLWSDKIRLGGGIVSNELNTDITHIIVDNTLSFSKLCSLLGNDFEHASYKVVIFKWILECLRTKSHINENMYLYQSEPIRNEEIPKSTPSRSVSFSHSKANDGSPKENEEESIYNNEINILSTPASQSYSIPSENEINSSPFIPSACSRTSSIISTYSDSNNSSKSQTLSDIENSSEVPCIEREGTSFFSQIIAGSNDVEVFNQKQNYLSQDHSSINIINSQPQPSPPFLSQSPSFSLLTNIIPSSSNENTNDSNSDYFINHNQHITCHLEPLVEIFTALKDNWRSFAYKKAVYALKNHPKKITTIDEAKTIKGIGDKILDKINEILTLGKCTRTENLTNDPHVKTLLQFMNIWGVGCKKAQELYSKGYRTIEDIEKNEMINLTEQQRIGVKYYNDINQKMPREEAHEIEKFVEKAAKSISNDVIVTACGSYRRGKSMCGDVDILITTPNGECNIIFPLIEKLACLNFLKANLSIPHDNGNFKMNSYMGICKLLDDEKYKICRRIDIKVYPISQYAFAVLYFTGSDNFNRSMRLYARRKGWSLSDQSLTPSIFLGKEHIQSGETAQCNSEEEIFRKLGIPFVPPNERETWNISIPKNNL